MSITASDARKRLFPLIQQVNDDATAIEIVSKHGTAFLMSDAEYRSLRETEYLLRSPKNARRLFDALDGARRGATTEHDLVADE